MNHAHLPETLGPIADYTVTFVPEIGRVEVTDASGQPVGAPGELDPATAGDISDQLAGINMAFGRPDGPVHLAAGDVIAHPDIDTRPQSLAVACSALAQVLPREVFNYIGTEETPIALSLGRFGVAARRATSEELPQPDPMEELARLDAEKIDLTTYDHAIVTVDGTRYAIPFDTSDARLLARTVDAIRQMRASSDPTNPNYSFISMRKLPRLVWSAMPSTERALYTKSDKRIRATGSQPIRDRVDALMNKATNLMGITRRVASADTYLMRANEIAVEYCTSPQEEGDDAIQVVAPGAPQGVTQRMREQQVPAEDFTAARTALGYMSETEWFRLSQEQAVDLVEFIMTREGKVALLAAIADAGVQLGYTEVYERLHDIARYSLGTSYYPTRDAMVISGSSWTSARPVRQIGGSLPPGATRADVGFSKWTLFHPPSEPGAPRE